MTRKTGHKSEQNVGSRVGILFHCSNVPTTPLRQWGFRQCLPFSLTTLRGKHCRHPIAVMGVVGTFEHYSR